MTFANIGLQGNVFSGVPWEKMRPNSRYWYQAKELEREHNTARAGGWKGRGKGKGQGACKGKGKAAEPRLIGWMARWEQGWSLFEGSFFDGVAEGSFFD